MGECEVDRHYQQARETALKLLERRARGILRRHSSLGEFVMSMGIWGFTYKNGERIDEPFAYMRPISDLISRWDDFLKLTGEPMRFTAKGEITRDW